MIERMFDHPKLPVRLDRYGTWQLNRLHCRGRALDVIEILGHWISPDLARASHIAPSDIAETYQLRLAGRHEVPFDATVTLYGDLTQWWMTAFGRRSAGLR